MPPNLTPYFLLVWLAAAVLVFPAFPPHRAMLGLVLSGTLFLPEITPWVIEVGPLKLFKPHTIGYAGLLATLFHQADRLRAVRFERFDWPMLVWCMWPIPSGLLNDPPPDGSSVVRDALSHTLATTTTWGIPYLLGRVYFTDPRAVRDLAVAVVIGAAVYAPLCLWETRMSPHLHATAYGMYQHDFLQTIRFGGFRPMVFLQHGLAVGLFMTAGALLAVWLWRPAGLPGYLLLLVPVAVLVKSSGALALGLVGGAVLWLGTRTRSRWWLTGLAALAVAYVASRATGIWSGADLLSVSGTVVEADRVQSLEFRFRNENLLIARALERPLTGWSGWGRNLVRGADGRPVSVPDGLWVIVLGDRGGFGLVALGAALLLPVFRLARRTDPARWHTPALAPAVGCAVVLTLWCLDSLFNAMILPVYPLMAGALADTDAVTRPADEAGGHHPDQE